MSCYIVIYLFCPAFEGLLINISLFSHLPFLILLSEKYALRPNTHYRMLLHLFAEKKYVKQLQLFRKDE